MPSVHERSIPDSNCRKFVVVAQDAQSAGVQKKMTRPVRGQPNPTRNERPQNVSMPKDSNIPISVAQPGYHAVHSQAYAFRRFAPRATISKNKPARRDLENLFGRQALIFSIVPFQQVCVDDGFIA